jgi:hypothetical protein
MAARTGGPLLCGRVLDVVLEGVVVVVVVVVVDVDVDEEEVVGAIEVDVVVAVVGVLAGGPVSSMARRRNEAICPLVTNASGQKSRCRVGCSRG